MTERKKYEQNSPDSPYCAHCGQTLSYHDFASGVYSCRAIHLASVQGILSVQEVKAAAEEDDDAVDTRAPKTAEPEDDDDSVFHSTIFFMSSGLFIDERGQACTPQQRKRYPIDERCRVCGVRRGEHEASTLNCPREALSGMGVSYEQLAKDYDGISYKKAFAEDAHLTAPEILKRAAQHMEDRAAARDQPGGERSMARTVKAFNAITGHEISERDGWMFMVALKAARACTTQTGLSDDYEDGAAYFGLAGESAQR